MISLSTGQGMKSFSIGIKRVWNCRKEKGFNEKRDKNKKRVSVVYNWIQINLLALQMQKAIF